MPTKTVDYAAIIREIGRGTQGARPLSQETAHALFADLLADRIPDLEKGAVLLSLRIKGETTEELLGFHTAVAQNTRHLQIAAPQRLVVLPTYNGARKEANLMPLVALLLQRRGIPVLIHGRQDFTQRGNSFDVLAKLGVPLADSLISAQQTLLDQQIACLPLAILHPELDALLALRLRLGVRNVGHTLAKLLDPCPKHSVLVVPLTHPHFLDTLQTVLPATGLTALLMRGTEGEAYANPHRRPAMLGCQSGQILPLLPQGEPVSPHHADSLPSNTFDPSLNAEYIQTLLADEVLIPQAILDQVRMLERLAKQH